MNTFTRNEILFIKKQIWINEFISVGRVLVLSDLRDCLEPKEKANSYIGIKKLGLTATETVLFYGKILSSLDFFSERDNCSVLTGMVELDLDQIKSEINVFLKKETKYICENMSVERGSVIIYLEEFTVEPNEDFDVDYDIWEKYMNILNEKYDSRFMVPYYYWGK